MQWDVDMATNVCLQLYTRCRHDNQCLLTSVDKLQTWWPVYTYIWNSRIVDISWFKLNTVQELFTCMWYVRYIKVLDFKLEFVFQQDSRKFELEHVWRVCMYLFILCLYMFMKFNYVLDLKESKLLSQKCKNTTRM